MSPAWSTWLTGAANAAVSGAASGITVYLVAPDTFNFTSGLAKLATVVGVSALVSLAKWVVQHPITGASANGSMASGNSTTKP